MAKTFLLSDESVNSYGFRVITAGIDITAFLKNPVMLFDHRLWGEGYKGPIGKWDNTMKKDKELLGDPVFDTDDDTGATISNKVEKGFIRAASIGFEIIETSVDPKDMLPGQTRATVTKCKLIEVSVVGIPSNENALALYDNKGQMITLSKDGDMVGLNAVLPLVDQETQATNSISNMDKHQMLLGVLLGLSAEATIEQIYGSVVQLKTAAEANQTKLSALEASSEAVKLSRNETLVDAAINTGKILASERSVYLTSLNADFEGTKVSLDAKKPVKLPSELLGTPGGSTLLSISGREEWGFMEWLEKDSVGLNRMKSETPAEYDKLFNEHRTALRNKGAID